MHKLKRTTAIYIAAFLLILVIGSTVVVVMRLGVAYKGGLSSLTGQKLPEEVSLKKKKNIKKITVQKEGSTDCMEVTPDGIVKIYTTCGQNLDSANRLTDTKNILKLFKLISESDLNSFSKIHGGTYYRLLIETDEGTQTVYIYAEDSDDQDEIIETIEDIEEDIPHPSTTPTSSPGGPGSSSLPSPSVIPSSTGDEYPSPVPSTVGSPIPFVCNFVETALGQKKPVTVSNIICSTDPSPVPF